MGSNPVGASEFFLGFLCNCLSYFTTAKISFTSILYPQFTHMIFIVYTSRHSQFYNDRTSRLVTTEKFEGSLRVKNQKYDFISNHFSWFPSLRHRIFTASARTDIKTIQSRNKVQSFYSDLRLFGAWVTLLNDDYH